MKKEFKKFWAIVAVLALFSVNIFGVGAVTAKAVEGEQQQEEISNQEEEITNQDTDTENPDGDENDTSDLENPEENVEENSNQEKGSSEEPAPKPRMMLLGASGDPTGGNTIILKISYDGNSVPGNYGASYVGVDESGTEPENPERHSISGSVDGTEVSDSFSVSTDYVKIRVTSAGKDIFYNGEVDNEWENGKIVSSNGTYAFQLKDQNQGGGQGGGQFEGPMLRVTFDTQEASAQGKVQYKASEGGEWSDVSSYGSSFQAIAVRVLPNEGYSLVSPTGLYDGNRNSIGTLDSLVSEDGVSLTENTQYELEHVCFSSGGTNPGGNPGSLPMSTFSMTYKDELLGNGTVYYQAENDEWRTYSGGEVAFTRLILEPNDEKEYIFASDPSLNITPEVEIPEGQPSPDEVWGLISSRNGDGGIWAQRGWKYTFSNIQLVEDNREPSKLTVGPYDSSNGRFYYFDVNYIDHIVPVEGVTSVDAKEIWVENNDGYILEDSFTASSSDSSEDITELKRIILNGEHYWLDREKSYSISEINFKADDRPLAKLSVGTYTNTNGKVYYQDENDVWQEISPSGVTEVFAKAVKAEGRESKYTLKETRDGQAGWQISVSGGQYDDTEGTKREFENHFSADQQADLMLGMNYTLTGIVFEQGKATFRWSYADNIPGHEDEYVGHGQITITGASYNGQPVTNGGTHDADVYWINNSNFNEGGRQWQGGEGAFLPGTVVTIILVPDRGYQLTRFQINGQANTTQAQGAISTFTFTVPSKNFHLGASFTEMNDEVKSNASGISGGSLEIGDSEFSTGTAALAVNNTTVDGTEESAFAEQAEGYNVDKYVDLAVQNIFYMGNTTDYWPGEEKHQLDSPASISLNVSGISGTEVEIVHQKSSGEYEVIPATYSNGVVTFNADSFSKFAIVSKGAKPSPSPSPTSSPKEEPAKQETSSENTSVVPVTVPDTTVVASIGGTTVTEKDTKDNVAVMVGGTKNGAKISEWNELATYLATPQTATPTGTTSQTASLLAKPIELVLCKKNTVVPETVFDSLAVNPAPSMHIHIRDGVAMNFINDANLTNQQAVDLKCVITSQNGYAKGISFNSNAMLNAITTIHATVPKTVKSVNVYTIDKQGKKTLLWANIPVIDGRYCFLINQLGTFEIEY